VLVLVVGEYVFEGVLVDECQEGVEVVDFVVVEGSLEDAQDGPGGVGDEGLLQFGELACPAAFCRITALIVSVDRLESTHHSHHQQQILLIHLFEAYPTYCGLVVDCAEQGSQTHHPLLHHRLLWPVLET